VTEEYVSDGTLVDTIRVEQGDHNRGNASVSCSWMLFTLPRPPKSCKMWNKMREWEEGGRDG
jgi:hypothetical protein